MSEPSRSYVVISRERIARNCRGLPAAAGPSVAIAAVVKADGYGHGALEVSRILIVEGAKWLAVSSVEEGVMLRHGGIVGAGISVMSGFFSDEGEALVGQYLTAAAVSLDQIREPDRLAARGGKPIYYRLRIDSAGVRVTWACPVFFLVLLTAAFVSIWLRIGGQPTQHGLEAGAA